MDIGSAKASEVERQQVRHHCINIAQTNEIINVKRWSDKAKEAIDDIIERGKKPIVVGGTGFYIRWLLHPPPENDHQNQNSNALNPAMSTNHESTDSADFPSPSPFPLSPSISDLTSSTFPFDVRFFYLSVGQHRDWLSRRIDRRCESMIEKGIIQETMREDRDGRITNHSALSTAIGYRQCLDYLHQLRHRPDCAYGKFDRSLFLSFIERFQGASRRYARSQEIWFRKEKTAQFILVPFLPSSRSIAVSVNDDVDADIDFAALQEFILSECSIDADEYWQRMRRQQEIDERLKAEVESDDKGSWLFESADDGGAGRSVKATESRTSLNQGPSHSTTSVPSSPPSRSSPRYAGLFSSRSQQRQRRQYRPRLRVFRSPKHVDQFLQRLYGDMRYSPNANFSRRMT